VRVDWDGNPVPKEYAPENPKYMESLKVSIGTFFYLLCIFLVVYVILFSIIRFAFGRCGGPKTYKYKKFT